MAKEPVEHYDSVWARVNKYGTYNVQRTANTDNEFPAIAQGLSKKKDIETKKDEIPKRKVKND